MPKNMLEKMYEKLETASVMLDELEMAAVEVSNKDNSQWSEQENIRANILSEISTLEKMIKETPEENAIDLVSLKSRKDEVLKELEDFDNDEFNNFDPQDPCCEISLKRIKTNLDTIISEMENFLKNYQMICDDFNHVTKKYVRVVSELPFVKKAMEQNPKCECGSDECGENCDHQSGSDYDEIEKYLKSIGVNQESYEQMVKMLSEQNVSGESDQEEI